MRQLFYFSFLTCWLASITCLAQGSIPSVYGEYPMPHAPKELNRVVEPDTSVRYVPVPEDLHYFSIGTVYGNGGLVVSSPFLGNGAQAIQSTGLGPSITYGFGVPYAFQYNEEPFGGNVGINISSSCIIGSSRIKDYYPSQYITGQYNWYGFPTGPARYYELSSAYLKSRSITWHNSVGPMVSLGRRISRSLTIGLHLGAGLCLDIFDLSYQRGYRQNGNDIKLTEFTIQGYGIGVFYTVETFVNYQDRFFLSFSIDGARLVGPTNRQTSLDQIRFQIGKRFRTLL